MRMSTLSICMHRLGCTVINFEGVWLIFFVAKKFVDFSKLRNHEIITPLKSCAIHVYGI